MEPVIAPPLLPALFFPPQISSHSSCLLLPPPLQAVIALSQCADRNFGVCVCVGYVRWGRDKHPNYRVCDSFGRHMSPAAKNDY